MFSILGDVIGGFCNVLMNDSDNRAMVRMNDSDNIAKVAGGIIAAGVIGYGIKKFAENNQNQNSVPRLNSGK